MRRSKYDNDGPSLVPTSIPVAIPRQSLEAWIIDLCSVRDCRDGFVSREIKGYETLFACPLCDRSKRDLYPYQSIPSAKKWMGGYLTYTDLEMFERKQNRKDVADSLRRGAGREPDLEADDVGGPF